MVYIVGRDLTTCSGHAVACMAGAERIVTRETNNRYLLTYPEAAICEARRRVFGVCKPLPT